MANDYVYENLTLHGRFREDGEHFDLFVLLNGVEVLVQTLAVRDQRERFEDASHASPAQPAQTQQQ